MNNKNRRYLIILGVLALITAITIGYSAFSNTLTIDTGSTSVSAPAWAVKFSKSSSSATTGSVTPTTTGDATGGNATLAATTISGLSAAFTGEGTVKYSFYSYNTSTLTAYLNSVDLGAITCAAASSGGASASYVTNACNSISMSVKVKTTTYNSDNTNISSHTLAGTTGEAVEVTISCTGSGCETDGTVNVTIGDTTLVYGSTD